MDTATRLTAPLTPGQQGLWLLHSSDDRHCVCNEPAAFRLAGTLDERLLRRSLHIIFERQSCLRTSILEQGGQVCQRVESDAEPVIDVIDLSATAPSDAELSALMRAEARRPFDLAHAPLLRVTLYRLGAAESVLLLVAHHIIMDGWSVGLLINELKEAYEGLQAGRPADMPPLPLQYICHARELADDVSDTDRNDGLAYWRRQLEGLTPLELAISRIRPARLAFNGARRGVRIPRAVLQQAAQVGRQNGATLPTVLAGAFCALLARDAGRNDVATALPSANRYDRDIANLIGHFSNPVVLRLTLPSDVTFAGLLRQAGNAAREALAHSRIPFESVIEALAQAGGASRSALTRTLFNVMPGIRISQIGGAALRQIPADAGIAKYDLSVFAHADAEGMLAQFEYNTVLFQETDIARLGRRYLQLLEQAAARPDDPLRDLKLEDDAHIRRMLQDRNRMREPPAGGVGGSAPFVEPRTPMERRVADLFAELLGHAPVGAHSSFYDLGGSSLAAIRLATRLNSDLGFEVPLHLVQEAPTVGELARRLGALTDGTQKITRRDRIAARLLGMTVTESRLVKVWNDVLEHPAAGPLQSLEPLHAQTQALERFLAEIRLEFGESTTAGISAGDLRECGTLQLLARQIDRSLLPDSAQLVCLRRTGGRPPLVLIHAAEGHTSRFRALSAYCRLDRPIYAVRAATVWDRGLTPYDRHSGIEQVAAAYLRQIRTLCPTGSFALGGACSGAVIAYEMARQLHADGSRPEGPVLMLDPYLPPAELEPAAPALRPALQPGTLRQLHRAAALGPLRGSAYVARKSLRTLKWHATHGWSELCGRTADFELFARRFWAPYINRHDIMENAHKVLVRRYLKKTTMLLHEYRPGPYAGRLLLLWSAADRRQERVWNSLVGGRMDRVEFSGKHLGMLEEPAVQSLAAVLERHYGG